MKRWRAIAGAVWNCRKVKHLWREGHVREEAASVWNCAANAELKLNIVNCTSALMDT